MKVSEAKEKVCPFMNATTLEAKSFNDLQKCIADKCMAWVVTYTGEGLQSEHEGYCARITQ